MTIAGLGPRHGASLLGAFTAPQWLPYKRDECGFCRAGRRRHQRSYYQKAILCTYIHPGVIEFRLPAPPEPAPAPPAKFHRLKPEADGFPPSVPPPPD